MSTPWKVLVFLAGLSVPLYAVRWEWFGLPVNVTTILSLMVIMIWVVTELRYRSLDRLMRSLRDPIVWLFVLWISLGVIISQDLRSALGMWLYVGTIPLLTILCVSQNDDNKRRFSQGLVWSGVGLSLLSLGQILLFGGMYERPTGLYNWGLDPNLAGGGFANYIGMLLVPLVFLAQSAFSQKPILRKFIIGTLITGVLASQSLSAIGSLAIVGVIALFKSQNLGKDVNRDTLIRISILTIIILTLFISWQIQTPKIQNLADMSQRNSISTRVQIWQASQILIQDSPLFGIGLVDYERRYQEVIPEIAFPPHEWIVPHPHNLVMGVWLMGGVLGVVWFYLVVWKLFRALLLRDSYSWYLALALLSILIIGLVDFPFGRIDIMMVWWTVLFHIIKNFPQ